MASLPALALTQPSIPKPLHSHTKCIQSSRFSSSFSRSYQTFSINANHLIGGTLEPLNLQDRSTSIISEMPTRLPRTFNSPNACSCQLPLVGYPAPDFQADEFSDQKTIKVKDSDQTRKPPDSTFSENVRTIEKLLHLSTRSTRPTHHHEIVLSKPSPGISSSKESLKNPEDTSSPFFQKTLYLESIGLDPLPLIDSHPPIIDCPLPDLKSTVDFLRSYGFSPSNLCRIFTMCPEALMHPPSSILSVFTFLLREANIDGSDLVLCISRRPRLLVSDVARRLRPTMYFLHTVGIVDISKHTSLLSCSVEDKFLPRLEFFQKVGFSYRDSVSMVRRFPQLFCLGIESNLQPKFNYFISEMGGQLEELKEFPQYFSFSLDCRIKPRHRLCVDKGVYFPLPAMLKWSEKKFLEQLESFHTSSQPRRNSPLWHSN